MNLITISISGSEENGNLIEKLSLNTEQIPAFLHKIFQKPLVSEVLILSTCNRFEVILHTTINSSETIDFFKKNFMDIPDNSPRIFTGINAVNHLYRVACGIESPLLGEAQISGQVKRAYTLACKEKTTGYLLNHLLHSTFRVAKLVRTQTSLNTGSLSLALAAVKWVKENHAGETLPRILILGAGEMARLTVMHCLDNGFNNIVIANRSDANAESLALSMNVRFVSWENRFSELKNNDVLFAAASVDSPLIDDNTVEHFGVPALIVDYGMPHCVCLNNVDTTTIADLNELKCVTDTNRQNRLNAIPAAESIIKEECEKFKSWYDNYRTFPVRVRGIKHKIIVGTRSSKLAVQQTQIVENYIKKHFPQTVIEIKTIETEGDKNQSLSLIKAEGKGLFTKSIEDELLNGSIDIAIHSFKDLPTVLPNGITASPITDRENPFDVFISRTGQKLSEIKQGAIIGTCSLRRAIQLGNIRTDLIIKDIRGNIDTRLKKMDDGYYDGIILAYAGLSRLSLQYRITETLDWYYAPGQGALAAEYLTDNLSAKTIIDRLINYELAQTLLAERTFLHCLGGGCSIPAGIISKVEHGKIHLKAWCGSADGKLNFRSEYSNIIENAADAGKTAAQLLLMQGAGAVI